MLNLDDLVEKKGTEQARLVCEVSQQSFNHVTCKDLPLPPSRIVIIITTTIIIIISNGNRTEWIPVPSVIIRVINKIGRPHSGSPICLITSMITDRIGRHEVLLPVNHNYNKICDIIGYFLNQNTKFEILFC